MEITWFPPQILSPDPRESRLRKGVRKTAEVVLGAAGGALGSVGGLAGGAVLAPVEGARSGFSGKPPGHDAHSIEKAFPLVDRLAVAVHDKVSPLVGSFAASLIGGAAGAVIGITVGSAAGLFYGFTLGASGGAKLADHIIPPPKGELSVTAIGDKPPIPVQPARVVAIKGPDKIMLMDQVIQESRFFDDLEAKWKESGKPKDEFSIALKPNLMMMTHKEDPVATYTDPELLEYLIDGIREKGFTRIYVVESQNTYGNWYRNRSVENVARVAGMKPEEHGYRIVDLTLDQVPHSYGGRLGNHPAGRTWKEADYRISFAKNKTHISCVSTLTLKNLYGLTPLQDKGLEYHAKREWDKAALDMMRNFPVDFGFVDGFWSADGLLGFKGTPNPKKTEMIFAGKNLVAIDTIATRMMGVNPKDNNLIRQAAEILGDPEIELASNVPAEYRHPDWDNVLVGMRRSVPDVIAKSAAYQILEEKIPKYMVPAADVFEESYASYTAGGILSNVLSGMQMDPAEFPVKPWDKLGSHIQKGMIEDLKNLIKDPARLKDILEDLGASKGVATT
ncbi:MAG: DUF362 domain-containing protein [Armatimonadetes bacterium]|nr:DUF362 domain-containing protein [Armatimonadota bacterium]